MDESGASKSCGLCGFHDHAWKCNICERYTCPDCLECKSFRGPHTCSESVKSSLAAIRSTSRKCPSCQIFIQRQEGCDQMYCTYCHTAFSWNTGQRINGRIHNPHWYEAQRHGVAGLAREWGDIPCGGRPAFAELTRVSNSSKVFSEISRIHRLITHIADYELHQFPTQITDTENVALRIRFILNDIDKATFSKALIRKEKSISFKRDVGNILQMCADAASDLLRQMCLEDRLDVEMLRKLFAYVNISMKNLSSVYNYMTPQILMPSYTIKRLK